MQLPKTRNATDKLIDFTLRCKICFREHRTRGYKDNPPAKYCCGFQMRVIRPR